MKKDKKLEEAIGHSKLKKRASGSLEKEDLSGVVKAKKNKPKLKTFTLRLPETEQLDLLKIVAEVNEYSNYKKVSANDLLRSLIATAKTMNPEKLYKAVKDIH